MVDFKRIRFTPLIFLLAVLLAFAGCAAKNTTTSVPAAPTPAQIITAKAVDGLAQAVDGAVTAAIAARDAGKVSQVDLNAIENLSVAIAMAGKQVDAELRSSDTWEVQKVKIMGIVAGAGLGELKAHISPAAQLLVSSLVVVVNQVLTDVGGPTI